MPAPKDLIHETSASTGTGNLTLAAVNGKVRFSDATYGFGTGGTDAFWYFVSNRSAAEWETGTGHMSDANTLVRDTVLLSSNANAAVNFSAGVKDVANDIIAAQQVRRSELATVATTGAYSDLSGKPTLGTMAAEAAADYTPTSGLATIATTGAYANLASIPAAIDAIDGLTPAADRLPYYTSGSAAALATFTTAGRNLLDDADAAAQATTLGLGTGNTPQFTGIEVGHASDTTLTRASAGNLAVEGNALYRAGGTDVPVADGGTGRSSHTAYAVLCGGTTTTAAQQSIAGVGTSGQVLTSNGASALPTFQDAAGGGVWEQFGDTGTISGGTATIEQSFTAGRYSAIKVIWSDVPCSTATNSAPLVRLRVSTTVILDTGGSVNGTTNPRTGVFDFILGIVAGTKRHTVRGFFNNGDVLLDVTPTVANNASAPNNLQFRFTTGDLNGGRIMSYGLLASP